MANVKLVITGENQGASEAIDKTTRSLESVKKAAEAAAAAFGVYKAAQFIEQSTMMAARNETLAVVMKVVGQNAGYTASQMDGYAQAVAKMGITVEQSRESITRMAQANLDLTKSSQLARVAQDAAVIAGMNSSQAMEGILHGITTLQPEILRTYGITVNFEQAYAKAALTMGKTVEMLTQNEKQQIAMNSVLEQGKQIAGAYEASLGTVGKAIYSLQRYVADNKAAFGELFTPALKVLVDEFTNNLKDLGNWFLKNKDYVRDFAKTLADDLKTAVEVVKGGFQMFRDVVGLLPSSMTDAQAAVKVTEIAMAAFIGTSILGITRLIGTVGQLTTALAGLGMAQGASAVGGAGALVASAAEARITATEIAAARAANATWLTSTVGGGGALATMGQWGLAAGLGYGLYKGTGALLTSIADNTAWGKTSSFMDAYRTKQINPGGLEPISDPAADKAIADADSAAKATAGKLAQAKKKAEDEAFLQQQLDKKTHDARMRLSDEGMKYQMQQEKNLGELSMNEMKHAFDQGKIASDNYYNAVKQQIYDTAVAEAKALSEQKNRLIDDQLNNPLLTPEQKLKNGQDILQIMGKEDELVTKVKKSYQDADAERIKDQQELKASYRDSQAAAYDLANEYVKGVQEMINKDWESIETQKLMSQALAGNAQAEAILANKMLQDKIKLHDADLKAIKDAQDLKDAIFEQSQYLAKKNGADQAMLDAQKSVYDNEKQISELTRQLDSAELAGKQKLVDTIRIKLGLAQQENDLLKQKSNLLEQVAVLEGTIVGFDNGKPIYANAGGSFNNGVAVDQYQSASDLLRQKQASAGIGSINSPSSGFINSNIFSNNLNAPFMGGFATGTNYVPADGFAYLHKGEAVVPAKYNNGGGGITINGGLSFNLPNVTNQSTADDLARAVIPKLQEYMKTRLRAA